MTNVVISEISGNNIATSEFVTSVITVSEAIGSSAGGTSMSWYTYNLLGSALSGSTGAAGRILTLNNTGLTQSASMFVFRNNNYIMPTQVSVNNLSVSTTITLTDVNVFDDDTLSVTYGY